MKRTVVSLFFILWWFCNIQITAQNPPTSGLVAFYPFNGNSNDESGNGNNGIIYGATSVVDRFGKSNSALIFDGDNDYIEINHSESLNLNQQVSISFWIKFETNAPYYFPYHIIEKHDCWGIGQRNYEIGCNIITPTQEFPFWTNEGFGITFKTNRYYHFVFLYDGTQSNFYVDGVPIISIKANGPIKQNTNKVYISRYNFEGDYFFDGTLDDFRIYNRPLSESEIVNLYHEGGWGITDIVFNPDLTYGSIIDPRDGHIYKTIKISNQNWMAENLGYLPSVSPSSSGSLYDASYYVNGYQGTNLTEAKATYNYKTYGVLYNFPAAIQACPTGWHLPTDEEWTILATNLGGIYSAGGKLKEVSTVHWIGPNTGASNESGFTALPGDVRLKDGTFGSVGSHGYYWSSSIINTYPAHWGRDLNFDNSEFPPNDFDNDHGLSVRCIKTSSSEIISPNGGETLISGNTYDIKYLIDKEISGLLSYSIDNGYSWKEITSILNPEIGEYTFTWNDIPNINSHFCLIKIQDSNNPGNYDISDEAFYISQGVNIPISPTELIIANSSANSIEISWKDNSPNESGFKIFKWSDDEWAEIGSTVNTSYLDTNIQSDKTYHYKVQAFNNYGNSEFSNTISITIGNVPDSPTSLSLSIISSSEIKVTWSDNSNNEDGFKIERKTGTTDWLQIKAVYPNSTNYIDNGLAPGNEYFYRVKAFNLNGESSYSNVASIILGSVPSAPQNLLAQTNGINSVKLSWEDMSGNENGFYIYRKDWNSTVFNKIKEVSSNTNSYFDNNLLSGKQYSYKVYAFNNFGQKESNIASAVTGSIPNPPSDVKASLVENNRILLSWKTSSSNVDGYNIQRSINSGTWENYIVVNANTSTTTTNTLTIGSIYQFRIRSENEYGVSSWSLSNSLQIIDLGFSANIVVMDRDGYVAGAEIYIKKVGKTVFEKSTQTTNAIGSCQLQNLRIGDEILVRKEKTSLAFPSKKDGHGEVDDKVYVVYFDNGAPDDDANYTYKILHKQESVYRIILDHPVIGYNIIVSLKFTNPQEGFKTSFKNASEYLYNVTDGQAFLNKVYIYENSQNLKEADIIIEDAYNEAAEPNADNFGIFKKDNFINDFRIRMGRSWLYKSPGNPNYDRTIIHEFGHYGFGFYDEYLSWDPLCGKIWDYRWSNPDKYPINYGFMDSQIESYFRSYGINSFWIEQTTEMSSSNDYNQYYDQLMQTEPRRKFSWQIGERKYPCWEFLRNDFLINDEHRISPILLKTPSKDYFENGNNVKGDRPGPYSVPLPYISNVGPDKGSKSDFDQLMLSFKTGNKIFMKSDGTFCFLGKALDLSEPLQVQVPQSGHIILHKNKGLNYQTSDFIISGEKSTQINDCKIDETKSESPGILVQSKLRQTNPTLIFDVLFQFDNELPAPPEIHYYFSKDSGEVSLTTLNNRKYLGTLQIDPQKEYFDGTGYLEINFNDGANSYTYIDKVTFEGLVTDEDNLIYNYQLFMVIGKSLLTGEQIVIIDNTFGNPYNANKQDLIPVSELYSFDIEYLDNISQGTGLTISYDDISAQGIDETSICLYHWNRDDEFWEKLDSAKVYPLFNSVSSPIYKEGTYALFAKKYNYDFTAPAGITDLEVTAFGNSKYELTWTSPGDDSNDGQAMVYDIRFSDKQIDNSNWDACNILNPRIPLPAGNDEDHLFTLNDSILRPYFAIKTIDDANNISPISNVVSAQNFLLQESPTFALTVEKQQQVLNAVFLGKDVNATDNYDALLDKTSTGPANGINLYCETENSDILEVDYRSKTAESLYWKVKAVFEQTPDVKCTLAWDETSIPGDGYYYIGDFNMKDTTSLIFESDTTFIIHFMGFEDITTGINKFGKYDEFFDYASDKIQIYPNPSKDFAFIHFNEFANYDCQISILDMTGQLLYKKDYHEGSEIKTIEIRNLSRGVYVISISINNYMINKKLIIN